MGRQTKVRQGVGVGTGRRAAWAWRHHHRCSSEYLSVLVSAELSLPRGKGTEERPSQGPSRPVFSTGVWKRHKLESKRQKLESPWTDPI